MLGAFAGLAVVAAAASVVGYQTMAPTGQWFGPTLCRGPRESRQIALTFDDGPNDPHTLRLLDVLAKNNVRATFFMIGRFVQQRPDIARAAAQAGHVVGNHTFTHPLLTFKTQAETRAQLVDCRSALEDAIGGHSSLFRPPFGGRRPATLRVARELALQTVMWNVTGYDWNAPLATTIDNKIAKQMGEGGGQIILLHDGSHRAMGADRGQTVIAAESLIRRGRDEGRRFVTVEEMMAAVQP